MTSAGVHLIYYYTVPNLLLTHTHAPAKYAGGGGLHMTSAGVHLIYYYYIEYLIYY
jgi:hypothetical protein